MRRLMLKTVFSGLTTACRFAVWPTSRSLFFEKATTDGSRRLPSAVVVTTGSPPSITAATEFVVPRSIPIILDIVNSPLEDPSGLKDPTGLTMTQAHFFCEVRLYSSRRAFDAYLTNIRLTL